MTYPPQGQPGDPYSQPPGGQPPAGGYVPGQAGPEYTMQPPQYTQPEMSQPGYPPPPGYPSQPGYPPQGHPDPYGQQYGPPPVQPVSKGGSGTAILIVVVLILMIGGGVAGYLLLGGDDEGTTTAGEETTSEAEADPSDGGEEPTEEGGEEPVPDGDALTVESLGAVTPLPGDPWEPYAGPGAVGNVSTDTHALVIQHTESWISYMEVGLFDGAVTAYDPADLQGSAEGLMNHWAEGFAFGSVEGLEVSETEFTDVEVDGRPAVLAESTVSWTSSDSTEDGYEDIAFLVVDVDGVNGFIGLASVPESGTEHRQAAVDALLATTFEGEAA
ncbi:flagellar basal body-associated FliL family protein [Glycomyces tarimensis]